jgi:pimeloyl-ACP methyl ester carboxylesterase
MQVFADDGARIDVRVDGSNGVPVLLIAGFPLTREIWNSQSEVLSQTHRVVRPNLRGMGKSSVTGGPYLMEALASDVAAALDALGLERAAIVGHSLGGYVALAFARMFTERISHLALVCSRLAEDTLQRAAARRELADRAATAGIAAVREAYLPLLTGPQTSADVLARITAMIDETDPRTAAAMLRGMALRAPADDIAAELAVPVLVLAGACDPMISAEEARAIAQTFPRGRLVVCERSGHLPMLEQPERVTAALADLISE